MYSIIIGRIEKHKKNYFPGFLENTASLFRYILKKDTTFCEKPKRNIFSMTYFGFISILSYND